MTANIGLLNESLFDAFHKQTTEMIVTKERGRKMFPKLEFTVNGLFPEAKYVPVLIIQRVDDSRYKYSAEGWQPSGKADDPLEEQPKAYNQGAVTGQELMLRNISFDNIRLTNNPKHMGKKNMIVVSTMHKYQPVVYVYRVPDTYPLGYQMPSFENLQTVATGKPTIAQFIAVTAYFNDNVKKLKINTNPYAKGHMEERDGSKRRTESNNETTRLTPSSAGSTSTETSPQQQVPSMCSLPQMNYAANWWPQMYPGYPNFYSLPQQTDPLTFDYTHGYNPYTAGCL